MTKDEKKALKEDLQRARSERRKIEKKLKEMKPTDTGYNSLQLCLEKATEHECTLEAKFKKETSVMDWMKFGLVTGFFVFENVQIGFLRTETLKSSCRAATNWLTKIFK